MGEKIVVVGNWEICNTIINALVPAISSDDLIDGLTVLTYPSQTLSLPRHVPPSMVEHKTSDFSAISLEEVLRNQDVVINTMSGGDVELQTRLIDAAVAAGVKKFIPHEFGHDTLNQGIQARIIKYAGRSNVLQYLQATSVANPDFEWTAVATGYTLDKCLINGDLGFDMEWHSATMHGIGTESFAVSSLERVGSVVVNVLQNWAKVRNQYIYAAGTITSANEILRSAEKITGHEWTVGNYDVEDCLREGQTRIERGFPDAGMILLDRSILYDEELNASAPFERASSNGLLSLVPESVDDIVTRAYHDLKHYGKPGCGCST